MQFHAYMHAAITVKNKVCIYIPHQLVYHMTLRSVNYSNYSVISTPQCHITHYIFTIYTGTFHDADVLKITIGERVVNSY